MPYSRQVFQKVLLDFEKKREKAQSEAQIHRDELHRLFPDIAGIDRTLSNTGLQLFAITSQGGEDLPARVEKFKSQNLALQKMRGDFLRSKGLSEDYTKPKYECGLCNDSGYVGIDMCSCMKKALSKESYISSGLGQLSSHQTFDTFDLNMYSNTPNSKNKGNISSRALMEIIRNECRLFCDNFDGKKSDNLFFIGSVGVGKTHLTSAIAYRIIERGFDVVYDSAQTIMYNFEKERFNRSSASDEATSRYFECDLLIIDDLGTEYSGNVSSMSLFNIINTRTLAGKSIIISTNLPDIELQKRYDQRILSRLFGEFRFFVCCNEDIRLKKKNYEK